MYRGGVIKMELTRREYKKELITRLFKNSLNGNKDIKFLTALNLKDKCIVTTETRGNLPVDDKLRDFGNMINKVTTRLQNEALAGSGSVSYFDFEGYRLISIVIENIVLFAAFDSSISFDGMLPLIYMTAEKLKAILNDEKVDLAVPVISMDKSATNNGNVRSKLLTALTTKNQYNFKVIVIGDENVGKTALIYRFSQNRFKEDFMPTLGVSITNNTTYLSQATVNFFTWDMGGQKKFRRVRTNYYKGADGCFIAFDLSNKESFDNVLRWNEEKEQFAGNIVTVLLGMKSDLLGERAVMKHVALKLAKKHNFSYIETSAKLGINVQEAFTLMGIKLIENLTNRK
ncbi:MAG: Rab family GTPase [Promethearchaeota archaeon]